MSFFGKLKERLFKSSSKIDEGLDAIVAENPEPEAEDTAPAPPEPGPEPEPAPDAAPEPVPDAAPEHVPDAEPQPVPASAEDEDAEADAETEPAPASAEDDDADADAAPEPVPETDLAENTAPKEASLVNRALGALTGARKGAKRVLDDAMLESLEELLIAADMGMETSLKLSARLAEGRLGKAVSTADIKAVLAGEIAKILEPVARPLPLWPERPQVVLVVGVNGSGKTTTIGKLAAQLKDAGKSVVIAAGDTFRAAAVEQLCIWGERAGAPVVRAEQGSDPASLAFDAMARAESDGADMLLIDTAGRLQNRTDLMEELARIIRAIRKRNPDAPHNTVLVLDATTGQNALSQVEMFQKIAEVSGIVMTKLDGTAKGGVLVALADRFGLPVHAIGVGEKIEDLDAFDAGEFARALTGAPES